MLWRATHTAMSATALAVQAGSRVAGRTLLLVLAADWFMGTAQASAPTRVSIDVGTTVECHDVTPAEFTQGHPQEKIVEATFHVSALLMSGRATDLEELHLIIESREGRMRVVDFKPRTELASDLAGDVEVSATVNKNSTLNASLGSVLVGQAGPVHVQASPGPSFGTTNTNGTKETYRRLSSKQLVLASGTVNAEHGVFFKWRHSNQNSLEGSREVSCRFVVPREWRGDWVQANCEVLAMRHSYLGSKVEPCDQVAAVVGLYLVGDAVAQQAARELAAAQCGATPAPDQPGAQRQVCNKPVAQSKSNSLPDWIKLSPIFKLCNQPGSPKARESASVPAASVANPSMSMAMSSLKQMSGK